MMRKKGKHGKFQKAGGVLLRVMQGVQYVPDNVLDKVRIREMAAIDNLASGEGTDYDLSMIIGMLAVCEYLASKDNDQQAIDAARTAEIELQRVADTHKVGGYVQMTETCLAAIKRVYTVHDEQRVMLTWRGYEEALQAVNRKIVAAQAAEKRAGTRGDSKSPQKVPKKSPAIPVSPQSPQQSPIRMSNYGILA